MTCFVFHLSSIDNYAYLVHSSLMSFLFIKVKLQVNLQYVGGNKVTDLAKKEKMTLDLFQTRRLESHVRLDRVIMVHKL